MAAARRTVREAVKRDTWLLRIPPLGGGGGATTAEIEGGGAKSSTGSVKGLSVSKICTNSLSRSDTLPTVAPPTVTTGALVLVSAVTLTSSPAAKVGTEGKAPPIFVNSEKSHESYIVTELSSLIKTW